MADVLRNSVSIIIPSHGFSRKGRFYSRPSTSECRIGRRYISCLFHHSSRRCLSFGYSQFKDPWMKSVNTSSKFDSSIILSNMVASVELELVCESEEESHLIKGRNRSLDLNLVGQNLPPWGNVGTQDSSDSEPEIDIQPSSSSQKNISEFEVKVHLLEERNEEILSRRLLMLSRSNKVRSALELYESMKVSDLQPNVHACNSLISCLLRNKLLHVALGVFEFMRRYDIITGHSYSLMLKAIAKEKGFDSALDMFVGSGGYSRKDNFFDVVVYNTMISICGRLNNWIETERLWRSMKENGHIGTRITYSLLVCIFVRCSQNELALDAYNEMILNGIEPGEDVGQAMISSCTKEGKWDLALNIFEDMLNRKLKPNQITCNALINSLGKAGEVKFAFKVTKIMKTLGYEPDAYTWNSLMNALYKANQHANAITLFEKIKRENSAILNVHLYNTALMSCQKLGSWEKALQILWGMETSGFSVTTSSYNLVIGACEIARKPKVALQVYEHMVHQKCTPDTFTHMSLVRGCVWGSLWDEVEEILSQVEPDVSLYNAVIQGMCLRGKFESAKKLYRRLQKNGLKPDGKTRAMMLQNLWKDSTNNRR